MESGLFFYADGKDDYDYISYSCKRLGRYWEFLNGPCQELFKKDLTDFTTLTKSEWDPDIFEGIVEKESLPDKPNTFDPEDGTKIIDLAKSNIISDDEYMERFIFHGVNDYKHVLKDLDEIKSLLLRAKKENRKWHVAIVAEM